MTLVIHLLLFLCHHEVDIYAIPTSDGWTAIDLIHGLCEPWWSSDFSSSTIIMSNALVNLSNS